MAKPESLFDKRVVERNLESGVLSREDLQKYLKSLKDLSENVATLEAEMKILNRALPTRSIGNEDEEL